MAIKNMVRKINWTVFAAQALTNVFKYVLSPALAWTILANFFGIRIDEALFYSVFAIFYVWSWIHLLRNLPMHWDVEAEEGA